MPTNQKLIDFLREVKKRGYNNSEIIPQLLERGWSTEEISLALKELASERKEKVEIYLDKKVLDIVSKRAKRNFLSLPEQIEDIVRRSSINAKLVKNKANEKLDDLLVGIFSRKRTGRKKDK